MGSLTLEEVNNLGFQAFTEKLGSIIENTPLVAATIWSNRPFQSVKALHDTFCMFLTALPPETKAGILRCHPDLAGKLAMMSALSRESTKEQKGAGLLELSDSEREELTTLNHTYKKKFEFPFVICARENKKEAIFSGMRSRLSNDTKTETETGIREVCKIAWYRLVDIVRPDSSSIGEPKL